MPVQEKNLLKTEQISQSIFEILEKNFDLKLDKNNKNIKDQNFFGKIIKFKARDLVYLVFLLEQKYNIDFNQDDIDNVSMYTINGLSEIIAEHLNCC